MYIVSLTLPTQNNGMHAPEQQQIKIIMTKKMVLMMTTDKYNEIIITITMAISMILAMIRPKPTLTPMPLAMKMAMTTLT